MSNHTIETKSLSSGLQNLSKKQTRKIKLDSATLANQQLGKHCDEIAELYHSIKKLELKALWMVLKLRRSKYPQESRSFFTRMVKINLLPSTVNKSLIVHIK